MSKQSVCGVMVKVHKLCSSDKYIYIVHASLYMLSLKLKKPTTIGA